MQPAGGNRLAKVRSCQARMLTCDSKQLTSLQVLAGAGVASRRAAEQLIFQGCVTVNGKQVLLPQTPVDLGTDQACTPCLNALGFLQSTSDL